MNFDAKIIPTLNYFCKSENSLEETMTLLLCVNDNNFLSHVFNAVQFVLAYATANTHMIATHNIKQ